MTTFFTADPHFGHRKLAAVRGYPDTHAMNLDLTAKWNTTVGPNDTVYVLGDVSFMSTTNTVDLLNRLHGTKHLVRGNHDRKLRGPVRACYASIEHIIELKFPDTDAFHNMRHIVLCHYPMLTWNKSHWGSWHLHGHSHGRIPYDPQLRVKRLDVGFDSAPTGGVPMSYAQIKALFT